MHQKPTIYLLFVSENDGEGTFGFVDGADCIKFRDSFPLSGLPSMMSVS